MVLPGLRVVTVIGWLSGVVYLTKPWGIPKFRWISVPFFLCAVYIPVFIFFILDVLYHYKGDFIDGTEKHNSKVDSFVQMFTFFQLVTANVLMRIVFLWKARKLADLLERLRRYGKAKYKPNSGKIWDRYISMHRPLSTADSLTVGTVFWTTLSYVVLSGIDLVHNDKAQSWIDDLLGSVGKTIIYSMFFLFPVMVPIQFAFALVATVTAYLTDILEDYCKYGLDRITKRKRPGMSIVNRLQKQGHSENWKDADGNESELDDWNHPIFFTDSMRRDIINRFEIVWEIFELAHEIIGPIALILLSSSSLATVVKAYEIILIKKGWMSKLRDALNFINVLVYYWVLECGQRISDKIEKWKEILDDAYLEMSDETHQLERQTIKDMIKNLKFWNWKFTAMDFFVIDRKLASGIVSLILTYVVVLVQLKVSDAPQSLLNATRWNNNTNLQVLPAVTS